MNVHISIVTGLWNSLSAMFLTAFLLSLTKQFRTTVYGDEQNLWGRIALAAIFGAFGIMGTYYGFPVDGAIANSRAVAVVAGGLIGGPIVGVGAGIIAGVHRYAIDIGGFTALACMFSTIVEGSVGAVAYHWYWQRDRRWLTGFWTTVVAEVLQMLLIVAVARPFTAALALVSKIGLPMILVNACGVSLFILLHESIYRDRERQAALQSEMALRIADQTLPILRNGLSRETAQRACEIIHREAQIDAVALTSRDHILAHVGLGTDHHLPGMPIQTLLSGRALTTGSSQEAETAEMIACSHEHCPLQSAVIVPLFAGSWVIGLLKLYRRQAHAISSVDHRLAEGLAKLFSTQLELAEKEQKERLLAKAELRALQAQINPHFLFNALNTIVSFCRSNPETARRLLLHLGDFLRASFIGTQDFVPLSQELEHVRAYLEIEQARFGDRLAVDYDLQSDDFSLPPLILQPLVENSVTHGISPLQDGGKLYIETRSDAHWHTVKVSDNGIGFDLKRIVAKGTGIGLDNVDKRLRSVYGQEFGLQIISTPGSGTTCVVRIPKGENPHDRQDGDRG